METREHVCVLINLHLWIFKFHVTFARHTILIFFGFRPSPPATHNVKPTLSSWAAQRQMVGWIGALLTLDLDPSHNFSYKLVFEFQSLSTLLELEGVSLDVCELRSGER